MSSLKNLLVTGSINNLSTRPRNPHSVQCNALKTAYLRGKGLRGGVMSLFILSHIFLKVDIFLWMVLCDTDKSIRVCSEVEVTYIQFKSLDIYRRCISLKATISKMQVLPFY